MPGQNPSAPNPNVVLVALVVLCCVIEAVAQAADHGLIGSARLRPLMWEYGAFWAGLLGDWRPNYAGQPAVMFFSYALLHDGFWHLLGNMVILWMLGRILAARGVDGRGLLLLWVLTGAAGGLAFGALSASPQPMIGASGPLFGLAGAWKARDWQAGRDQGRAPWPIVLWVLALAALNLALWAFNDGRLAWQTHLGGFVAGWMWTLHHAGRPRPV